jgi:hypothetical protein
VWPSRLCSLCGCCWCMFRGCPLSNSTFRCSSPPRNPV